MKVKAKKDHLYRYYLEGDILEVEPIPLKDNLYRAVKNCSNNQETSCIMLESYFEEVD